MKIILVLLLPLFSLIISGILAFYGLKGWGWFLFVAVILSNSDDLKKLIFK